MNKERIKLTDEQIIDRLLLQFNCLRATEFLDQESVEWPLVPAGTSQLVMKVPNLQEVMTFISNHIYWVLSHVKKGEAFEMTHRRFRLIGYDDSIVLTMEPSSEPELNSEAKFGLLRTQLQYEEEEE